MNIEQIRKKFPQYNFLSDQELADKMHAKHYPELLRDDFYRRIGFSPVPPVPERVDVPGAPMAVTPDRIPTSPASASPSRDGRAPGQVAAPPPIGGAVAQVMTDALADVASPAPMAAPGYVPNPTAPRGPAPAVMPRNPLAGAPRLRDARPVEAREDLGTPRPPEGERAPYPISETVRAAFTRPGHVPGTASVRPISSGMTGTERNTILGMTKDMEQGAQLAVLQFVDEAMRDGAMGLNEALIYAIQNVAPVEGEVPRTGLRGLLGGTRRGTTGYAVPNTGGPTPPEGFVLDP